MSNSRFPSGADRDTMLRGIMTRLPRPALRPFVGRLWAADGAASLRTSCSRERVLPAGEMHLAFRLSDGPFRFLDAESDAVGRALGHAVVGGMRAEPYFKDVSVPAPSVGVQLLPGASEAFFGVPAVELAGGHVRLDEFWGPAAGELVERLMAVPSPGLRLDYFERTHAERLPPVRGIHPAVAHALERFRYGTPVGEVVREAGYSHRRFVDLFRRAVGLTPKLFCRVQRFRQAYTLLATGHRAVLEVALEAGYSDQAHLTREFRELGGITPGSYRRSGTPRPGHVPVG